MLKRIFLLILLFVLIAFGATYVGMRIWFNAEINQICDKAIQHYEGDKVEALISFVEDDNQPLQERNKVIWALGKIRDKRALPVLKSLYTKKECDHGKYVCQRELEKAIGYLEDGKIDLISYYKGLRD